MAFGSITTSTITNLTRNVGAFDKVQKLTGKETPSEAKEILKQNEAIKVKRQVLASQMISTGVSAAQATYNTVTSTSRYGLRGQDIKDQKTIQDKLVNTGLSILGTTASGFAIGGVAGGLSAFALSLIGTAIDEAVSLGINNRQYEYNRAYDLDVTGLGRERQGAAAYNYSRRGA